MVEKIFLGDDYSIFRHVPESLKSEILVLLSIIFREGSMRRGLEQISC